MIQPLAQPNDTVVPPAISMDPSSAVESGINSGGVVPATSGFDSQAPAPTDSGVPPTSTDGLAPTEPTDTAAQPAETTPADQPTEPASPTDAPTPEPVAPTETGGFQAPTLT
jgi:hypothetical protein